MSDQFMTGFPGFLGTALLPRMLARRPEARVFLLVQEQHSELARERLAELAIEQPHTTGRVELVIGDITEPGLGMDPVTRSRLAGVSEVWHLAAVYDLSVPEAMARRVNVDGTAHVIEFARSRTGLRRLHHVSTCYVSGDFPGIFPEDELDLGQSFLNHYEQTKFAAEVLVHRAMRTGLPATIYRPGIVVGDSRTGCTQKYDGPYFLASFLLRQPSVAVVPSVGPRDQVKVGLVPRDYVIDAIDALSVLDCSVGKTYALTDPNAPSVREVVETFAGHLGKRVVWVPLPLGLTRTVVGRVPGMERLLGIPAEALDYFASPTTYSTGNAQTDLAEAGISCPRFDSYADRLLDYMLAHPEVDSAALV